LVGWPPLAIAFIRQNPPWVDLPLDYLKVRRGTGTVPHLTCGHRRRPETVESGVGDGGGGVVNELGYGSRNKAANRSCRTEVRKARIWSGFQTSRRVRGRLGGLTLLAGLSAMYFQATASTSAR